MKSHFFRDRRTKDRRRTECPESRGFLSKGFRRRRQRRRRERRRSFRIVYPLTLAPITLNGNFRIIDLSQHGIMLRWEGRPEERPADLVLGGVIDLEIRFHDGEILNLAVEIVRRQSERGSRMSLYAGALEPILSPARLSSEEAFLLRMVPDFCRAEWNA